MIANEPIVLTSAQASGHIVVLLARENWACHGAIVDDFLPIRNAPNIASLPRWSLRSLVAASYIQSTDVAAAAILNLIQINIVPFLIFSDGSS